MNDDIIGRKFGKLTVLSYHHTNKHHMRCYNCRCDCGNESVVIGSDLRSGKTKSCGCLRQIDMIGKKFGKLIVLSYSHTDKRRVKCYNCRCDCGTERIVDGSSLRSGNTQSCGCLQREKTFEVNCKEYGESTMNSLYFEYRRKAKRREYEFALTKERFFELTSQPCHYCGALPSNIYASRYNNGDYIYNGIDRIDNDVGYVEGNVVPCCKYCNSAKLDRSYDEFMAWIKQIYGHSIGKG